MNIEMLPERIYMPQIAKRWDLAESEATALFLGRNLIFTMIENVQRQIILHDFIAGAINDMAQKKGINVPLPPKAEFELFLRLPVIDEYLEAIIKQGYWEGPMLIHGFDEEDVGEIFDLALVTSHPEGNKLKISYRDLYVHSSDLLKMEEELGLVSAAKRFEKSMKNNLDLRSERTYLNIIGALLECVTGTFKDEQFSSEAQLRGFIDEKFDDLRGVRSRTLAEKFSLAKKALKGELD
jgi:hypothetical protein